MKERVKKRKRNEKKKLSLSLSHQQRSADGCQLPPRAGSLGVPSRRCCGDGRGLDHGGPGGLDRGLGRGEERLGTKMRGKEREKKER